MKSMLQIKASNIFFTRDMQVFYHRIHQIPIRLATIKANKISFFAGISFKNIYEKINFATIHKKDNKIVFITPNSFIKNNIIKKLTHHKIQELSLKE
jgi:hypothetical protein